MLVPLLRYGFLDRWGDQLHVQPQAEAAGQGFQMHGSALWTDLPNLFVEKINLFVEIFVEKIYLFVKYLSKYLKQV